jgi:hypothetical protein
MTITTTWAIAQLEHETADGFVFTAHWTVSAVSDVVKPGVEDEEESFYSAGAYGSIGFQRPDNLIPYENLTEEIVVGWVKEEFGQEKVNEIEKSLADNIKSQIHPTSESGVPW